MTGLAEKSETQELPPQCRHAHSFRILSWNSASQPPLFLPPYCCTSLCKYLTIWKFQSIALEPEIIWRDTLEKGRFQLLNYFSRFPSRFSVCKFGWANYFILFVFESSKRPSYDASWKLQSCALLGWFQSSNHFSTPPDWVLVCKSGHSDRSGPFVFETLVGMQLKP